MATQKKNVVVIEVWDDNLEEQLHVIDSLTDRFRFVSMDTEFPGTLIPQPRPYRHQRLPLCFRLSDALETYHYMKYNVNSTKLIQLGLTLSDSDGNLPRLPDSNSFCVWEFNFRDFDIDIDPKNDSSIQLLKDQGIDFQKNKEKGIDSCRFAELFKKSTLIRKHYLDPFGRVFVADKKMTWVTFHSAYDFGHLVKILHQCDLPDDVFQFMGLVVWYFGGYVYDMEHIVKGSSFYGGLEKIAKKLEVDRVAGKSHQAGSDSLLTMQTFLKLKERCLRGIQMETFKLKLSGLEVM